MNINVSAADHLLTTTRGVRRRMDFDRPVAPEIIEECIEIALQSPVGSLTTKRHFIVVTDPEKRRQVADVYGKACYPYLEEREQKATELGDDPQAELIRRNLGLAKYQADRMADHPVLIILALEGRVEKEDVMSQASFYGSILPAAWSLMLALRARRLGSCWTTLHLMYEEDAAKALGMPENVTQAVLLTVAYYTGTDFKPSRHLPAREQTHWNTWGRHR
ncbi:MAG: nitroreductase family protein [Dehalococcoidia bacterium]